jgi:hypothetical protein
VPDLAYIVLTIAFFAACAAYVGGCARIVGRETSLDDAVDASPGRADS